MKIVYIHGHQPMFEMTFEERGIVISALQTFCTTFPKDEVASQLCHTMEQIDLAFRLRFLKTITQAEAQRPPAGLTQHDLDGGSVISASVTERDSLVTIVVDRRDADNLSAMLLGAKLCNRDDREAMTKLSEIVRNALTTDRESYTCNRQRFIAGGRAEEVCGSIDGVVKCSECGDAACQSCQQVSMIFNVNGKPMCEDCAPDNEDWPLWEGAR